MNSPAGMVWTATDTPPGAPAVYASGEYRITHEVAGFGMVVVRAYWRDEQQGERELGRFAGTRALWQAQQACEQHAAERRAA